MLVSGMALAQPGWARPASQSGNLLANGGFETAGSGGYGDVPAGWLPWWAESPKNAELNYWSKPRWTLESLDNFAPADRIYSGRATARVITNWDPWWAGLKQTVNAPAGSRVRLTAIARAWAASQDWPAASDTTVPVVIQVGLEPNGSADQFSSTVVWSGGISPHNVWQTVTVEATVGAGGRVTAILSGQFPRVSRLWLSTFWDEVSLTMVSATPGTGTPTPTRTPGPTSTPTPTGTVPVTTGVPDMYVVKRGDTLSGIARRFNVSLAALQLLNNLRDANRIFVGQTIILRVGGTPPATGQVVYVVVRGDSLSRIARRYGVTVAQLKAWNGLKSDLIFVGQRLVVGP
jgi:LysM repeat protein